MRLPWHGRWVPHATLDILRGCNAACRSCYNRDAPRVRPLAELEGDLDRLQQLRHLHAITITGGEPTLHPNLPAIMAAVHRRGLRTCLISNGITWNAAMAADLRSAGLDMVLFHIQEGQGRPDCSAEGITALRAAKAAIAVAAGVDVAYSLTIQPDQSGEHELDLVMAEVLTSPHVHFLLLSPAVDIPGLGRLYGDLEHGLRSTAQPQPNGNAWMRGQLKRHGLLPFAWLPSSEDRAEPRWLSFTLAPGRRCVTAGPADWLLLRAARLVTGRYGFYYPSHPGRFTVQQLLNAICLHRPLLRLGILMRALLSGRLPRDKHLLVELMPTIGADGRMVICLDCPDATLRDGRLVPVCLVDLIAPAGCPAPAAAPVV